MNSLYFRNVGIFKTKKKKDFSQRTKFLLKENWKIFWDILFSK